MPSEELRRIVRAARQRPRLVLGAERGAEGAGGVAALARGRAHEARGPARLVFAALVAGALARGGERGPVLWIRAPGLGEGPAPDGLAPFFGPERVVLVAPRRAADALWCAEEALRSGAVALTVAELPGPVAMTPVRRLHLAAEAGAEAAGGAQAAPLALLLTGGEGGCEGVESRWRMAPAPSKDGPTAGGGAGAPAWRLERLRARLAPPRAWRAVPAGPEARAPLRLRAETAEGGAQAAGRSAAPPKATSGAAGALGGVPGTTGRGSPVAPGIG